MSLPKYDILLQPQGNEAGLNRLVVTVTLGAPQRKASQSLCCFQTNGNCVNLPHPYDESNFHAKDDNGVLEITFSMSKNGTIDCALGRDSVGDVVLDLDVLPRSIDRASRPTLYTELHSSQGGLTGVAEWFLPRVEYAERYAFSVNWDLSLAAAGTQVSWSEGAGSQRIERPGCIEFLLTSAFMVGPFHTFPVPKPDVEAIDGDNADMPTIHWFGELPASFQPILDFNAKMFFHLRKMFQDPDCRNKVYIRKVPRGSSGFNFNSCFILQYSDTEQPRHEADLLHVVTHEMIHRWAYLAGEPDGYQNMWFVEGIADFYSLYMPVYAGLQGVDYFCRLLDEFLSRYYTSPLVRTPLREMEDTWEAMLIPYQRGFMYFFLLDAQLRAKTASEAQASDMPLHPLVMAVTAKHYGGEQADSAAWREHLYPLLDKDAVDSHMANMMDGVVMEPDADMRLSVGGKTVGLRAVEQGVFELGFGYQSLTTRVIEEVVPGSRAEEAGLRNGDELVWHSSVAECRYGAERKLEFVLQRGGERMEGEYLPRSFKMVRSYQTEILE